MAVFTTVITEPLLRLIYPDRLIARDIAAAERAAVTTPQAYRVLVAVDDVQRVQPLVEASLSLVRGREPAQIILSHFRLVRGTPPLLEVSSGLTVELAHIAASLEELNQVARSVEEQGVECLVLDRSSSNMAMDLSTQASTVSADVVLLDMRVGMDDWRRVARTIIESGTSRLLVADFIGGTRTENVCVCPLSATRSDYAVLDVAIRLANISSAPLLLLDNSGTRRAARRIESTVSHLRQSGVAVRVAKADDRPSSRARVAVMALTDAFADGGEPADATAWLRAELTVLVRPLPDDDDDQLDDVLGQLRPSSEERPK
jgi:hypothetical protein